MLLLKPFLGTDYRQDLYRISEKAGPGFYTGKYKNGISAEIAVMGNNGVHEYSFPENNAYGVYVDLKHAINRGFVAESHHIEGNKIIGWIDAKTTCSKGVFRTYYTVIADKKVRWKQLADSSKVVAYVDSKSKSGKLTINVNVSSVSTDYTANKVFSYAYLKSASTKSWEENLSRVEVKGDIYLEKLFYSLLYRTIQSPFLISETDGAYRTIDGQLRHSSSLKYSGWAIWDNFKTQLPFISLAYPQVFQDITTSIANLYPYGKKDFSTKNESSNTVRTEHAIVVLLDAYRKGFSIDFRSILDSLESEVKRINWDSPDKALESAYDTWALSEIYKELGNFSKYEVYKEKAISYKQYWLKDFKDLKAKDVDKMSARNMYQGTIWQYRWSVPFDVKGLIELDGGEKFFLQHLDEFFEKDYFNRANQPDLQAPLLYNGTSEPWKAQNWLYTFAVDTVNNFYFNDNSKGIDVVIDRIFKNQPEALLRTMDNDAGSMSGWFLLTAIGLHPALVGEPIFYLNAPLFESVKIKLNSSNSLDISVPNYKVGNRYIKKVILDGEEIYRNWVSYNEIKNGARIVIYTDSEPNFNFGISEQYVPFL